MIYLIALTLAADAVAVSVTNVFYFKKSNKLWTIPLIFGFFQGLMTILGYFLGTNLSDFFFVYDTYVVFIILGFIGIKMIFESFNKDEYKVNKLGYLTLISQAVATSIDAFCIGVSLTFTNDNVLISSLIIGLITAFLCSIAVLVANKVRIKNTLVLEISSGIIMLLLAFKTLL